MRVVINDREMSAEHGLRPELPTADAVIYEATLLSCIRKVMKN